MHELNPNRPAIPEENSSTAEYSSDSGAAGFHVESSQNRERLLVRQEPGGASDSIANQEKIVPLRLEPTPAQGLTSVQVISDMIARLSLDVSSTALRRINLLVPTINLNDVFGQDVTTLGLARHLSEHGYSVRIVIVDRCDCEVERWKQQLKSYPGLEHLIDDVELAYVFDRSKPLEVSKTDVFIATTWCTAHLAHRATKDLGNDKFLYLIQEYEPFTLPAGSFASLAVQSYAFPHYAIFSTELLRDYFRQNSFGVFAGSKKAGDRDSISFQDSISPNVSLKAEDLASRRIKKLLFYSRPEAHAAHNMFETAVLALSRSIEAGHFKGDWEFHGIGTAEISQCIDLARGLSMQVMPRQSHDAYREVLRAHDLGLSLMYTPHPSLVPIEMASAGMLVVTNTFANKTPEALSDISSNILAVPPTIEDVSEGLREAVANIEDYDRRVRGAQVNWSGSWDESFNSSLIIKLKGFLDGARPTGLVPIGDHGFIQSDSADAERSYDRLLFSAQVTQGDLSTEVEQEDVIESLRKLLEEKEEAVNLLSQLLAQHENQLRRITNTLGWRLLSRYGPIKYSYVLPAYNWIRRLFQPGQPEKGREPFYENWRRRCEQFRYNPEKAATDIERFNYRPTFSIVMPVYNVSREFLSKALDSVLNQYYSLWELCVCDDGSTMHHVRQVLEGYAARDNRIKLVFSETNAGIAAASNRALDLATGEFIVLLDNDDELTPDALYEVARTLQEVRADLIYSDEDKIDTEGLRCEPFFKPAWTPDLLLSCNYISHLGVYRKSIIDQVGGFREGFDGSQDYDLVLRFTEKTDKIVHIPRVLYHWRKSTGSAAVSTLSKPYAYEAGAKALTDTLVRRKIEGAVNPDITPHGIYRVRRKLVSDSKVTIIIPTRDRLGLLQKCIESVERETDYANYEIVIVNNGSRERATLDYLAQTPHKVIHDPGPFNYSRLNNRAARQADGHYLLLLNNDIEVISGEWLSAMIEHAQRPEVGAVGAKLLFANNRIQHAGVILGLGGVANHSHRSVEGYSDLGYFGFASRIRNYSAVTGACLMIRRDLFAEIGGLNEKDLAVAFNDVDLCLRLRKRGYLIVYTPYALLYHKESASRGGMVSRFEDSYMLRKWRDEILNDPYYNPNLTLQADDFSIDFSKPESSYCAYSQELAHEIVGTLRSGRHIGQKFMIDKNDLCAVGVRFGTFQRACKGTVSFHLRKVGDSDCHRQALADASSIRDNEYHAFVFDPIPDSAGATYYFFLEYLPEADSPLTVWKSSTNSYVMGPHFLNHQPSSGTLSFKAFCHKQFRT